MNGEPEFWLGLYSYMEEKTGEAYFSFDLVIWTIVHAFCDKNKTTKKNIPG